MSRVIKVQHSFRGEMLWELSLGCGHVATVRSKRKPTRRIEPCETCYAKRRAAAER